MRKHGTQHEADKGPGSLAKEKPIPALLNTCSGKKTLTKRDRYQESNANSTHAEFKKEDTNPGAGGIMRQFMRYANGL